MTPPARAARRRRRPARPATRPAPPQARKLEGELDVRLATFGKLCSSFEYGYARGEAGLATEDALGARSAEIGALLARLAAANAAMAGALAGGGEARAHTLARHRDILSDFSQEHRRLAAMAGAARDRAELLGGGAGAGGAGGAPLLGGGGGSGMLMHERGLLERSAAAMDDVVGHALGVAAALASQRQLFDAVDAKVAALGAKFPVVNSLLNAVRRRKNRDALVMGVVVACCVLFLLIYWARK
jgi:Golgi SNAP receptor complex protein 1